MASFIEIRPLTTKLSRHAK